MATSADGKRQRGHEDRARDDDEQRDAEVAPEEAEVEAAEHPQALGNGLDAPGGVVLVHAP